MLGYPRRILAPGGDHMSEADEQRVVVEWCDWMRIPVFHIPNGGSRHKAEAARLKVQGVKAGVPDLCIPVARGNSRGCRVHTRKKHAMCVGFAAEAE